MTLWSQRSKFWLIGVKEWAWLCWVTIFPLLQGFSPSIFYPKRSSKQLFLNLTTQCEKMKMPFIEALPDDTTSLTNSYSLIVDALFGFSFKGPPRPQFADILHKLKQVEKEVPICSIDVPSGERTGVLLIFRWERTCVVGLQVREVLRWERTGVVVNLQVRENRCCWSSGERGLKVRENRWLLIFRWERS